MSSSLTAEGQPDPAPAFQQQDRPDLDGGRGMDLNHPGQGLWALVANRGSSLHVLDTVLTRCGEMVDGASPGGRTQISPVKSRVLGSLS